MTHVPAVPPSITVELVTRAGGRWLEVEVRRDGARLTGYGPYTTPEQVAEAEACRELMERHYVGAPPPMNAAGQREMFG